jgi:glycerol-3-phosphate O-acyltransferase
MISEPFLVVMSPALRDTSLFLFLEAFELTAQEILSRCAQESLKAELNSLSSSFTEIDHTKEVIQKTTKLKDEEFTQAIKKLTEDNLLEEKGNGAFWVTKDCMENVKAITHHLSKTLFLGFKTLNQSATLQIKQGMLTTQLF